MTGVGKRDGPYASYRYIGRPRATTTFKLCIHLTTPPPLHHPKMYARITSALLVLAIAIATASTSYGAPSPLVERASDISGCTVTAGGPLTAIAGNQWSGERINVGIAPGMTAKSVNDKQVSAMRRRDDSERATPTTTDISAHSPAQMSMLTTMTKSGAPIQSQVFEYASCPSIHTHNGESAHRNSTHIVSFGLLRPVGSKKHCLAWAADSAALPAVKPGQKSVGGGKGVKRVVDGECGETPQQYRTWKMVEAISERSAGGKYQLSLDGATPVVPASTESGVEGMRFYGQGTAVPLGAKAVSLVLAS